MARPHRGAERSLSKSWWIERTETPFLPDHLNGHPTLKSEHKKAQACDILISMIFYRVAIMGT